MGSNTGNFPQGNNDPTQPAHLYSSGTTQYGGYPTNPYNIPLAPPPPSKRTNRWLIILICVLVLLVFLLGGGFLWAVTRSTTTAGSSSQATTASQPTTASTQPIVLTSPIVTQPIDSTKQGKAIPSSQTDPPYTTPNGTVICSGDVSVTEPNGTIHHPDSDPTTGEVVAATGSGYTITFTYSASCIQYPSLTRGQVNGILSGLEAQQKSSGCVNNAGCTGTEEVWIFPQ